MLSTRHLVRTYRVAQKSKLLYCERYLNGQTTVLALNILSFCELSRTGKLATLIIFLWLNILCCTIVTSCFVTVQLSIIFQVVIMGKISKEDKILIKNLRIEKLQLGTMQHVSNIFSTSFGINFAKLTRVWLALISLTAKINSLLF